jgi:hypothetical protein
MRWGLKLKSDIEEILGRIWWKMNKYYSEPKRKEIS